MNLELLISSLDEQLGAVEISSIDSIFEGAEPKSRLEGFDLDANKSSIGVWGQAASSYQDALSKLASKWFNDVGTTFMHPKGLSSALSPKLRDFEKLMSSAYSKAFQAGALKMGNSKYKDIANFSPSEKGFIRRKISKEMGFLKRYLSQDGAKKLAGKSYRGTQRADGYIRSLDSMFFSGMVAGSGENHVFFWELGGVYSLHCPDCLSLNVNSPFTRATLPTVPRAGGTQCMSWCRCTLRVEGIGGEPFQGSGVEMDSECAVWDAEGVPVSGGVQKLFDDLYRSLNLARGKIAATVDDEVRKRWIAARIQVNQDIIDLAKSYKVRVVPKWGVRDIQANVNTLLKKGLVHVTDLSSIPVGSSLYIVNGGSMRIVTVAEMDGKLGFMADGRFTAFESPDNLLMFGQEVK